MQVTLGLRLSLRFGPPINRLRLRVRSVFAQDSQPQSATRTYSSARGACSRSRREKKGHERLALPDRLSPRCNGREQLLQQLEPPRPILRVVVVVRPLLREQRGSVLRRLEGRALVPFVERGHVGQEESARPIAPRRIGLERH